MTESTPCGAIRRVVACIAAALATLILGAATAGTQSSESSRGFDVYTIQQRLIDLGYLNYRATGNFGDITEEAVRSFQIANNLPADGMIGTETMRILFSADAVRAPANPAFKSAVGRAYTGTVHADAELGAWDTISDRFRVGATASITDYNTGERFSMRRTGGTNNAQVVTESATDAEKFEYVFGGSSWEHRPVLVDINGVTYAGSLFGMPTRLGGSSDSGMSGVTFLYFNNSSSDIFGLSDEEHDVSITAIAG